MAADDHPFQPPQPAVDPANIIPNGIYRHPLRPLSTDLLGIALCIGILILLEISSPMVIALAVSLSALAVIIAFTWFHPRRFAVSLQDMTVTGPADVNLPLTYGSIDLRNIAQVRWRWFPMFHHQLVDATGGQVLLIHRYLPRSWRRALVVRARTALIERDHAR